jgi:glucose 1-dehydrogenase
MRAIAAEYGSSKPRFVEVSQPGDPQSGEVLCRTLELGICGTDREILLSQKPWTPDGERHLILGHECVARVEAVGLGVDGFGVGELVLPVVRRALPGHTRRVDLLAFGAFVERGIVREHGFSQPRWIDRAEHLLKVPAEIVDLAVLAEPLACSEKAVNEATLLTRARIGADAWSDSQPPRVLVTGMGPIGFTAVLAAVARDWSVTMFGRDEPSSFRAALVERLGGRYVPLHAGIEAVSDVERDGYDLLLECTGSDDLLLAAAGTVRSCGVFAWLGSNRAPKAKLQSVDKLVREGLLRNHLHVGCVNAAPRDFRDALTHLGELAQQRRTELAAMITARIRPDEALWHYEHREPQGIKAVLVYE